MMLRRPPRSLPPGDGAAPPPAEAADEAPKPFGLRRYARPATRLGRAAPSATRARATERKQGGLSGALLFVISNMAYFAAAAMAPAHLLFAADDHPLAVRIGTAVPAILAILEANRFLRDEAREVPFVVVGLLQYYVVFCFGVFFDIKFYDLAGPVSFTSEARTSAGIAIALGAVAIWLGAQAGRYLGRDLQRWAQQIMPRSEVPEQWDRAFYLYAGLTTAVSFVLVFRPNLFPGALALPMTYAFALELVLAFALILPPKRLGHTAALLLLGVFAVLGLLRGTLEPIFHGGIAYVTGRWATTRAFSIRVVAAVAIIYVVLQPVKGAYREQVWAPTSRTGQSASVSDRYSAWENAFSGYFSDREDTTASQSRIERVSELGAVMHAFDMLPGRVGFLDGQGLLPVLYGPIPRFLWANKPTTRDTVQRYAVVFGRQTEVGARSTAIALPLLVEGYWNFGWPGIVLVTAALGLWLGASQKVFSGDHWAMRATGIANVTTLAVAGPVVYAYGAIFQTLVGRAAVCWAIFALAAMLSRRRYDLSRRAPVRALRH